MCRTLLAEATDLCFACALLPILYPPVDSVSSLLYRDNVVAGIKGACPAPLIAPQSALVDWGAGFPAATYANQLSLVLRTRGRELP